MKRFNKNNYVNASKIKSEKIAQAKINEQNRRYFFGANQTKRSSIFSRNIA
jgi:hypothetical protein